MSRRQRLPSWVDDSTPSKPQPPLRYRIDPTAEKSDQLDKLLAELEAKAPTMEDSDYHDLKAILKGQQEALHKRVDRLKGKQSVQIDCSYEVDPPRTISGFVSELSAMVKCRHPVWFIVAIVVVWFIIRNTS